ncbi:DedA family protein [Niallia sp. FSL R7-0648]|uniref:DedA family protein n=1 Tax=Niallia sp. FSL R7-0648 TaxID=2954521 RepID=UPI0030F6D100
MSTSIHFISQFGYIAIFVLFALSGLGIPVPDEALLTFVGYLSSISIMNFLAADIICFIGALSAMVINYTLGKKIGKPFLLTHGKWIKLTPSKLERVENWFDKYGPWTIVIANFIPGVRRLTSYFSGISGMNLSKYMLFAAIGSFLWCLLFNIIGYYMGVLPF